MSVEFYILTLNPNYYFIYISFRGMEIFIYLIFFTLFSKFIVIWYLFRFTCIIWFMKGRTYYIFARMRKKTDAVLQSSHVYAQNSHTSFAFLLLLLSIFFYFTIFSSTADLTFQRRKWQLHGLRTKYQLLFFYQFFYTLWPNFNITKQQKWRKTISKVKQEMW